MTKVLFKETIENPLGEKTNWGEHERFSMFVYDCKFNSVRVRNIVAIVQQEDGDEDSDDPLDTMGKEIITTADGARALAAALIRAADAADAAS